MEEVGDRVYVNEGEAVIYRDGKIHAIQKISQLDEEFFKAIKVIFPESEIHILGFDKLKDGLAYREHKAEEEDF